MWGQKDAPPLSGAAPTDRWESGEVVVDRYQIQLAPDAPRGHYEVEIGMYRADTGQRLAVEPAQPDNRVVIGVLSVER